MKKYFSFCLVFILIACAAPITEVVPTEEFTTPPATPSLIPATLEPKSFFTVFGKDPIVTKGNAGAWDAR